MSGGFGSIFAGNDAAFPFTLGGAPPSVLGGEAHLSAEGESSVLSVESETGTGQMRFVEALPGVTVSFNDFRMARCVSAFATSSDVLCIDWCREGRIEQPLPDGSLAYVSSGDLKVDDRSCHTGEFVFPTARYEGVTVSLDLSFAPASIHRALPGFPLDLRELKRRFCRDGRPFLLHGNKQARRIAAELYEAPQRMRVAYCQVKALELLLFLESIDDPAGAGDAAYFPRSKVARVKEARDCMVSDLSENVRVEDAARAAGMSLTVFKECFKGVYGTSPAAYVRAMRMELAAKTLRETDLRIAEVGALVGYDSPSKFSVAFKGALGITPSEYRRRA